MPTASPLPPAGHRQLRCHYPTSRSPIRSPRGDRVAPPLRRQRSYGSHRHRSAAGPLCCGQRGFPFPATSLRTLPKVTAPAALGRLGGRAESSAAQGGFRLWGGPAATPPPRLLGRAPALGAGHIHPLLHSSKGNAAALSPGHTAALPLSPAEKGRGGAQRALTEILPAAAGGTERGLFPALVARGDNTAAFVHLRYVNGLSCPRRRGDLSRCLQERRAGHRWTPRLHDARHRRGPACCPHPLRSPPRGRAWGCSAAPRAEPPRAHDAITRP